MMVPGNPVFWILLALAVAALAIFLERLLDLRRARIDWEDFIKGVVNILEKGGEAEALAVCEETAAPVANIVATAIRHRGGSDVALREAVDSQGRVEAGRLDRRLASLAIIGQVAPLIGLLGTVIGFIRVMVKLNAQEIVARADLMGPAMEALVSAVMGLAVAIPVVVMYGGLRIRMQRIVTDLEAAASQIVCHVLTHGGKEAAK